ncbi:hypothetical protein [Chitinophaga sp. YIM B06452]|uniref:hypothetical protein n=1 Tax=Chitinophaga sp. YIM B06452 TaxID=3082158 RepID=UPI0031FF3204
MLPFPFAAVFRDAVSGQTIRFYPEEEGYKFMWEGTGKLGTWRFYSNRQGNYLEIAFNYAREETYLFTVLQKEEDVITAFRIKDRSGREQEFRKV